MRNTLAIAKKELNNYFVSPVAYVVTAAFLVLCGLLFSLSLNFYREASMRSIFYNMPIILVLLSPALTMRLLAEESRSGTIELLLTAPVRDWEVVLGKFLGALGLLLTMLTLTLLYVVILLAYGNPDRGPLLSGYLGIILLGGATLSIGVLTSSLTQNQIVAAILAFVGLLVLWLSGGVGNFFGGSALGSIFSYLDVTQHYNDFANGLIDSSNVLYYLSLIVACLFLASKSLETRRWG